MNENIHLKFDIQRILENLKCPICYDYLDNPVMELPNQHLFCKKCILNWLSRSAQCPICKVNIEKIEENLLAKTILSTIPTHCPNKFLEMDSSEKNCDWQGDLFSLSFHKRKCEIGKINDKKKLEDAVSKIKKVLDLEISPHLVNAHKSIFDNYVKDWEWLASDERDWKWWWWADNEWWEEKACPECNILWHKYEEEILPSENLRKNLLVQNKYNE